MFVRRRRRRPAGIQPRRGSRTAGAVPIPSARGVVEQRRPFEESLNA
jgi:hypothetical protein